MTVSIIRWLIYKDEEFYQYTHKWLKLTGITYSSRAQESVARDRNPVPRMHLMTSSSSLSVADSVFMGRIKSRVETWWKACRDPGKAVDGTFCEIGNP